MATRHGDIHSETPLVRVARQGPEASFGSRMVGTIGPKADGALPELHIVTNHGNVEVHSEPAIAGIPREEAASPVQPVPETGGQQKTPMAILEGLKNGTISVPEAEELLRSYCL